MTHIKIFGVLVPRKRVSHFLLHTGALLMVCDALAGLGVFHHFILVSDAYFSAGGKVGAAVAGVGASIEAVIDRL
jgi:hypothetical protein